MKKIVMGFSILGSLVSPATAGMGLANSPMWYLTASDEEIQVQLDGESTLELCNTWKKASDNKGLSGDKARLAIGAALERRKESQFLCQEMGFGN